MPLGLTTFGIEMSKKVGGKALAKRYAGRVLAKLPPNPSDYEVQEAAKQYAYDELEKHLTEEELKRLKDCAYMSAQPLSTVTRVIGLEIRNQIIYGGGETPTSKQLEKNPLAGKGKYKINKRDKAWS